MALPQHACFLGALFLGLSLAPPTSAEEASSPAVFVAAPSSTSPQDYPAPPRGYRYMSTEEAAKLGYRPALELPYRPGQAIPLGYHVTQEPRRGLIIGGAFVAGVPYAIGGMLAAGAHFENATGFLVVPTLGPLLTLSFRNYECNDSSDSDSEGWGCLADLAMVTVLVWDFALQAGGTAMILAGSLSPRKKLVHDSVAWSLAPSRLGDGYGLVARGAF